MSTTASIEIDTKATNRFLDVVRKHAADGKTLGHSLVWGGRKVMQSLSAATPQSKKLRKVIENPNPRWKTDGRMARFGVMAYSQKKKPNPRFLPIRGTGEFGKIRFKSKTTGEMLVRDRNTGEVRRQTFELGKGADQIPGVMQSKKSSGN